MRTAALLILLFVPQEERRPVPTEPARQAALKTIREVFKEEYAKRAPEDRRRLGRTLLQQAAGTKEDAPSEYVLLQEARTLAAETGDIETAFRAAEELGRRYEVDILPLRAATLGVAGQAAKTPDDMTACAFQFLTLADEAARALDFGTAEKSLSTATTLAKTAKNVALVSKLDARTKQLSAQKVRAAALKKAQETIAKNPEDAEANGLVGAFVCFVQEDWPNGLALLAKGPKSPARDAAEADLSNPSEAGKQAVLGDRWWDLSDAAPEEHRKAIRRRASSWYEMARAGLTGLAKVKVEKRISETAAPEGPVPVGADPAAIEAWKPSAPVSLSATKAPLKEALGQLGLETNYVIALGDVDPAARVTYKVEGVGFMGALDALCRAAGVTYGWDEEGALLRLTKERWLDTATTSFGPFLLLGRVGRAPDPAKTALWLYLDWEPRVKPVWYEITLEGATSDTGTPVQAASFQQPAGIIRDANLSMRTLPRSTKWEKRREYQKDYFLLDPAPGPGRKLASVRGKVDVYFPLQWNRARFDNVVKEAMAPAGPHQVSLSLFAPRNADDPWTISFSLEMATVPVEKRYALYGATLNARARFVDAGGRTLASEFRGNAGGASFGTRDGFVRGHRSWIVRGLPATELPKLAEIELITDVWVRSYSFELRDVPHPTR